MTQDSSNDLLREVEATQLDLRRSIKRSRELAEESQRLLDRQREHRKAG